MIKMFTEHSQWKNKELTHKPVKIVINLLSLPGVVILLIIPMDVIYDNKLE